MVFIGEGCGGAAAVLAALTPAATKNISAVTSVPGARARACLAATLSDRVDDDELRICGDNIKNVIVWGGDTRDPVVDASKAVVTGFGSTVGSGSVVQLSAVLREPGFTAKGETQLTLEVRVGTAQAASHSLVDILLTLSSMNVVLVVPGPIQTEWVLWMDP